MKNCRVHPTHWLIFTQVDTKDPKTMTLNDVLNSPERADGDTTWKWRLKPREIPVAFLGSGDVPDRGVYKMDDVSESTRQSLESIEPVQTIPRRSVSRSRRKRGSNFVEKQEIAAQMRQKDRDDARDAADAAMAYLQSMRDPLGDLKSSYREKYGDASTRHMVRGELDKAREHSTQRYKGMSLVVRESSSSDYSSSDEDAACAPCLLYTSPSPRDS